MKIISGGYDGAELAAIIAADSIGVYREIINYNDYYMETVRSSDGTVIFGNKKSRFIKLIVRTCKQLNKKYLINPTYIKLKYWISDNNINVLNVTGDRSNTNDEVYDTTKNTITSTLSML